MDEHNTINRRTDIRINIGLIASIIFGGWLFLYAEIQKLHESTDQRCEKFSLRLENKADRAAASDRYTGSQAKDNKDSTHQRFIDVGKYYEARFEELEKAINKLK